MLLDEDPAALIHSTTSNFHSAPDRASLSRISASLSTLAEARALRLSHATSLAQRLSRAHNTHLQTHALAAASHDPAAHAAAILALDTRKFRVAKEASDAEIEGERLEVELRAAERQGEELVAQGVEGVVGTGGRGEEEVVLKLKLYRSLGVDIEAGEGKAMVWNAGRGTAEVVSLATDQKQAQQSCADRIWAAL